MRTFNKYITRWLRMTAAAAVLLAALAGAACTTDDVADNRETDYGYVQFRLYKAASYTPDTDTRAVVNRLEYLRDASKIRVTMDYNGRTITQTLTLSASDAEPDAAEWGMRSEKIQLLTGHYSVVTYTLYDAEDQELYYGEPIAGAESFDIVAGGLTPHDLTANVRPRGKVHIRLVKDMSKFTRGENDRLRQYTLDEIARADISLRNTVTNATVQLTGLKVKFRIDFADNGDDTDGYRTSYSVCDSLISVEAGEYRLINYTVTDGNRNTLEVNTSPAATVITVEDNKVTEADIPVTLYESDEYIKDYYALRKIWEALDGPNWYYAGEDYAAGINWNFNKDIDLWGEQPGVTLHTNGRVSGIDISNFGFRGAMPAEIGQLSELISIYLGSHNDLNTYEYDPTRDMSLTLRERHLAFGRLKHLPTQMSEPIARALKENNISIPEIALYETLPESQVIDPKTGHQYSPTLKDVAPGKICNGLTSLPEEFGKLSKLEYMFIANSTIERLPDVFGKMESLTDIEVYNCPNMKQFPVELAKLPNLISANLANNPQWSADEALRGFKALATGASQDKIQILYYNGNNLEEIPEEIRNMLKIGLLDLASNKISKVPPFGRLIAPVQLYLDDNLISELPVDEEGFFCGYADIETFSAQHNLFTELPDIFSARSPYTMSTVDFSYNDIAGVQNGENNRGLNVETLTLAANKLKAVPKELFTAGSTVYYLNLRANEIDTFEKGWLDKHSNTQALQSLDLSYNKLTELPSDVSAQTLPYLYGIDLSNNRFASNASYWPVLNCNYLTMLAIRCQRDASGGRCLKEWPTGIYNHKGLRALYIGSNDLRTVNDTISYLIYYLDISDNPNIVFDASDICYYYQVGMYIFLYDKTQNILNCDIMLQ